MNPTSAVGNYETSSALPITWLGLQASYTVQEREIMAVLPVAEQTILHALKSLTGGEMDSAPPSVDIGRTDHPETPLPTSGDASSRRSAGNSVYLSPEDIPFGTGEESPSRPLSGKTTKKRPIYAVVWTWNQGRQVRTKALGTRKMRAWKRWYERQGWKVVNHASGYFARSPAGELHAILLHEYDRDTHERLA